MTYGSRDKSPFTGPDKDRRYYVIVDEKGKTNIYSSALGPGAINPTLDKSIGSIGRDGKFIPFNPSPELVQTAGVQAPSATEISYFSKPEQIRAVRNQAVIVLTKANVNANDAKNLLNLNTTIAPPSADPPTGTPPTATQPGTTTPTGTTPPSTPAATTSLPQGTGTDPNAGWTAPTAKMTAPNYRYPLDISTNQDCIKFEIYGLNKNALAEFKANAVDNAFKQQTDFGVEADRKRYAKIDDAVPIIVGIQGQIVDQNMVNWGAGELNELQKILANASATAMTTNQDPFTAMTGLFTSLTNKAGENSQQLQSLLYTALLEQAVGAPGLLSRITGGILNPNMELLFQGPQLRPFNFNFKMSPRSKDEAYSVKAIIRAFKRNMAPKVNNLFLQSPNVFKITYIKGSDKESKTNTHQSINLIKMCSLQNCSVDYTPLQTYMTYEDPEASMVSYNMSLSFSEITPIYQNDYDVEKHPIGF